MIPGISWFRIGAALALFLGLTGLGAWLGCRATTDHFEPLLAAAEQQIGQYTVANGQMTAAVQKQNDGIAAAFELAHQREQAAKDAQQTALGAAQAYERKAAAILSSRPLGVDECKAASDAFDGELQAERGQK